MGFGRWQSSLNWTFLPRLGSLSVKKSYKICRFIYTQFRQERRQHIKIEQEIGNLDTANTIRRHGSDVYFGISPVQNGGSYLMY